MADTVCLIRRAGLQEVIPTMTDGTGKSRDYLIT
jgi:hypothetical protein